MKKIARWRKQPNEPGRVCQSPRGYELRVGGEVVLCVAPLYRGEGGWYWYGMGQNTCQNPAATKEEAKAQADAFYRANKDKINLAEENRP